MSTVNTKKQTDISFSLGGKGVLYQQEPLIRYTYACPIFSLLNPTAASNQINQFYIQQTNDFMNYCEQVLMPEALNQYQDLAESGHSNLEYQANWQYTVPYNQYPVVSIYAELYEYTGGAHGNTTRSAITWNVELGIPITLAELFPGNTQYEQEIKNHIFHQIERQKRVNDTSFFEDYQNLVNQTYNPNNFYLTDDGLMIFFQQYDIAPYSSGIPMFLIPYTELPVTLPQSEE